MKSNQQAEFYAAVIRSLPRGMDATVAQGWIDNQAALAKALAKVLLPPPPTTMTLGERTYEILSFLKEGEECVSGHVMVARAREMDAHLGKEESEHFMVWQTDIPLLYNEVGFVFTGDWSPGDPDDPDCPDRICIVYWCGDGWAKRWRSFGVPWHGGDYRVLRRIK